MDTSGDPPDDRDAPNPVLPPDAEHILDAAKVLERKFAAEYNRLMRRLYEVLEFNSEEMLELFGVTMNPSVAAYDQSSPRLIALQRLVKRKGGTLHVSVRAANGRRYLIL